MEEETAERVDRNDWDRVREDVLELENGATCIDSVVENAYFALVLPEQDGWLWLVQQYP